MSEHQDVQSAARVAATLRTVLRGFRSGGEHALPLVIGEQDGGEPEAVLLPYALFQSLCHALEVSEDLDIARTVTARLAGENPDQPGVDTAALARLVAEGRPEEAEALLQAGHSEPRNA